MADELTKPAFGPTVRADHYRSTYINHARGNLTPWELQFTFGLIKETEPGKPAVEEQVQLLMTANFARALVDMLQTTIRSHETAHKEQYAYVPKPQTADPSAAGQPAVDAEG